MARRVLVRKRGNGLPPCGHGCRRDVHRSGGLLDRPRDRPAGDPDREVRDDAARLRDVRFLAHGTTLVINAITERKGVKTALVTTEGFRDSLEIARGNRPDYFNLHYVKPPPFVPRYLRREVPGRLAQKGEERWPHDI